MKVTIKPIGHYAEESQPNPLTWYILKQIGEDTFQNVSAPIICKDFFNDLAYTLQTGHAFEIYGFQAGKMELKKDKPIYMLLTETTPNWQANIFDVLNPWLASQGMPILLLHKADNGTVIEFDPKYFRNTYNISLVSLIIRLLNIEHTFKDFNEVKAFKKFPLKDQNKWDQVVKKNIFFDVPSKMQDYIWYCGETANSKVTKHTDYGIPQYVHNNGVLSWSTYL